MFSHAYSAHVVKSSITGSLLGSGRQDDSHENTQSALREKAILVKLQREKIKLITLLKSRPDK